MTGEQLRNSILQLAIQGKLVEQREDEGTAEELYEQIQREKERLILEGKLKKQKEFPEISEDEIPFEIPKSWKWVRLGECFTNKTGVSYKKNDLEFVSNNMVRILRGGNILDLKYKFKEDDIMLDSSFVKNDLLLRKNVLITPAVTSLENVGKIARITEDYTDVAIGGFVLMLVPYLNLDVLSQYLFFVLGSGYHRNKCKSIVRKSGQAFYNLSREKLIMSLLPLPPLSEQKRIVEKIEELMTYVEKYDLMNSELKEMNEKFPEEIKKSILQFAIQGKLVEQREEEGTAEELYEQIQREKERLILEGKLKKQKKLPEISEDEIPFEIPKSWKWVRLGEIGEIVGGGTPKTNNSEFWINGDIAWITPADMKNVNGKYVSFGERNITEKGLNSSSAKLMPKHSVIYSSRAPIGYVAIAGNSLATNQGFKSIVPYEFEMDNFLYYCLIDRTEDIIMRATGTTFKEISGSEFGNTIIPLPPLSEQKRIVEKIEKLFLLIDETTK